MVSMKHETDRDMSGRSTTHVSEVPKYLPGQPAAQKSRFIKSVKATFLKSGNPADEAAQPKNLKSPTTHGWVAAAASSSS